MTIRKNILVFGEKYFEKNQKDIINNYYQYCEKVTYVRKVFTFYRQLNDQWLKSIKFKLPIIEEDIGK